MPDHAADPPHASEALPRQDDATPGGGASSWLGRKSGGLAHYLWLACLAVALLSLIPRGARRAVESNTNNAEDWLPASYAESADLRWFRDHFVGESFVLVSWDGCTLGNDERLRLLERKLLGETDEAGWKWFPRVVTGPQAIADLTSGPAGLSRSAAIKRLEGALVGPPKTGADGESLGDGSRVTCAIAYLDDRLTENNRAMRAAVERVREIAVAECGVPRDAVHLGGPPVDNVTIDIEGERTLLRLAGLSALVGGTLAYLCFRSLQLTAAVFLTAASTAGMSLAIVFYYGVFEVFGLGQASPRFGKADAILMSMPAVVYVLALSGAIHLVNYYRDERQAGGLFAAAEHAVRVAWAPCLLAAFTTAVGLGSLGTSDILPIQKFGVFTAAGVLVAVGMLFTMLPVLLHRFPPPDSVIAGRKRAANRTAWYEPLARFVTTRHRLTTVVCLTGMALLAAGLPRIQTSVQLLDLLDEGCELIEDYAWLEDNLGNLVPMEVIVALDADRLRGADERAIAPDGEAYRMTMFERAELVRRLQAAVESLDPVSRTLAASTFAADAPEGSSPSMREALQYTTATKLEESREQLADYLQPERDADGNPTGRELWRVSARVTALGDVDYGQFVSELREQVEPVLAAYRQRDRVVQALAERGATLGEASVCVLTLTADAEDARSAPAGSPDDRLAELLQASAGRGRVAVYPLDRHRAAEDTVRAKRRMAIGRYDAVVTLSEPVAEAFEAEYAEWGGSLEVALVADAPIDPADTAPTPATEATAVYTGVVPVVYKTQRELLHSLRDSIGMATVLIAGVMVLVLRSPAAGLASMIPNVFPIVVVFGTLGWTNIPVDIGIMMTASVALGVAVDDTLHFVTWFGRGVRSGLDRRTATRQAFDRCATAMTQTTLIAGLGLAVFATSTFTPTQQFGSLMITMLGTALVGDLVLLPALLCGPLGRFFAPGSPATPDEPESGEPGAGARVAPERSEPDDPHGSESPSEPAIAPTEVTSASALSGPHEANLQAEQQAPPTDVKSTPEAGDPQPAILRLDDSDLTPANAALRAKLRRLRADASRGDADAAGG